MTTAVDTRISTGGAAAAAAATAKVGPRRRLFAKYAAALVGLVGLVLLVNGILNVWFSYHEARDAAVRLQREKADAAAQHIGEFIGEIEKQIGWTTATQWASSPIDQRRFDYGRLQRQVPAITELIQLDGQGREQLTVSRLKMDVVGSGADYSADPRFREALAKKVWFGPVYFRKESEPYMTMAVAQSGRNAGVTAAEVNLKLIWDVITAIKIGKSGYAYVVDGEGRLIAHPDISRVLRNTDLSALPQVAAARGPAGAGVEPSAIVHNLDGHRVLSASAKIPKLGWLVFVEQPISEALAPLYTTVLNTGLLLLLGLAVAILAGLLLARRMTGPIHELDAGAARIGAGALGHRITVNTGDELEELAQRFNTMAADLQSSYADLEKKVEDRTAELTEALDQQTATAEVLGVINSSPGDLSPVFDAMLEKATRLCGAAFGLMSTYDGEQYHTVATHDVGPELAEFMRAPIHPDPESALGRIERGEDLVLFDDIADTEVYRKGDPRLRAIVDLGGAHSYAMVALRKDRKLLGVIAAYRREVRPFSDKQIALLENFAAQAVIAMENARLITETREALEQQTATAEVLGVINSSPGDLAPVFEAMLEKAMRLCTAAFGYLMTFDGERFQPVAHRGLPAPFADYLLRIDQPGPSGAYARIRAGVPLVHIGDLKEGEVYRTSPLRQALVDLGGARTGLVVALRKDESVLGVFTIYRQEVRPFADKEIALLQNFAAQAVIAIENARLMTETREALDQQTATAEVLGVINSSPGELKPVFDTMIEEAVRLCEASHGMLRTFDGASFHLAAVHDDPRLQQLGPGEAMETLPSADLLGRIVHGGEQLVHIADIRETDTYRNHPAIRDRLERGGIRTWLAVALRKEAALLGVITVYRREVRPFTDKQIALLQNFAAQAVIAMENARLITETREALDQQTATAEVLGVINSSPGDLAPVFDAILEKAHSLCGADFGRLFTYDGELFRSVAAHGASARFSELRPDAFRPDPDNPFARILEGEPLIHVADIRQVATQYPHDPGLRIAVEIGMRTFLLLPLRKDNVLLGAISANRREVRPFTDKQIALLQNFAAQAVIAMENARLITETREALEQQTATAQVLGVINSSPGDLAPVFDAMLEKATRLCETPFGILRTWDGERFHFGAVHGDPRVSDWVRQRGPFLPDRDGSPLGRIIAGERVVRFADAQDQGFHPSSGFRKMAEVGGFRSGVTVALHKDDALLGTITVYRQDVRPFTDKQIALLQNFAAQAVIAMENARLITETREALEQQTATAEVLGVINSSPGDLAPVFDAMLDKATRLCEAPFGVMFTWDGERFHRVAWRGGPPELIKASREAVIPPLGSPGYRLVHGENFVSIADLASDEIGRTTPVQYLLGFGARSYVTVALRKDGHLLGMLTVYRQEVKAFSEKEIRLLQNFAAQAVIAMENARLITETQEALEQQTATAEVLGVINSSPGDLTPVFDAMLEKATRLCEAPFGVLRTWDGECFHFGAVHGAPRFRDWVRQRGPIRTDSDASLLGRIMAGERVVTFADAPGDEAYRTSPGFRAMAEASGIRSAITVALHKDDALLGVITVYRQEVRPFSDKQIALLQNFAAQAVIAIENARLITETREALEQQTATAEVLGVINSSPGDLAPVFDAILEKAHTLCEAAFGSLFTYDGERFCAAAAHGLPKALAERGRTPFRPFRNSPLARLTRGEPLVHVPDLATDAGLEADNHMLRATVEEGRIHTILHVPLRKDGVLLGVITAYRQEVRPFTAKQITLLQNFAAQAVIAIENARLLTELRQRTHDLQESLEYQTATSEVLKVISQSDADLDPVLEMLVETAARLCEAEQGYVFRLREGRHHLAASFGLEAEFKDFMVQNPFGIDRGTLSGRTLLERRVVHIEDAANDPEYNWTEAQQRGNLHTGLGVPLLREDTLIGVLGFFRSRVEPFTEKQIALVTTFADQAVIAIENARLLGDLQGRTHDLQESLEYQTATSDVLKVISQSGADLEPVLQRLVETAARLCDAEMAVIHRREGEFYRPAAVLGFPPEFTAYLHAHPLVPGRGSIAGRVALEGRAIHVADVAADREYELSQSILMAKQRTALGVPLLREDVLIGVIVLARQRVQPFSEKQIGLVRTFADQAVIAIENARLFNELRNRTAELGRSVDELKMLSEVGQAVSSTLDLRAVLSTILTRSVGLAGAEAGAIYRYNRSERAFRLVEAVGWDDAYARSVRDLRIAETETAMSEATTRRAPIQLTDLAERPSAPLRDASLAAGFRGVLIVPLVGPERILGALVLQRRATGEFSAETVQLMQTLASQSVLAIQNARLFREIADKSEQLALASQHKSQFLANMSHELRTPLNAILGYAELLVDGIYGALPERPSGVLERIQNNGRHLLALINDVLDLAKIEAGQLTLTLENYAMAEVVRSVVTATEPLATSKGLNFTATLQDDMPMGHGDARRVSQVLLNLVGNAIKFTEAGEVEISASSANGQFVLNVRDTGPGIPDADQDRIFGEFQQIDNSNTRNKGGTGLGLAISKRMVEMQGGTIAVESVLGQGSTFRVVLPVHVDEMMEAA